ncbi:hypothetical protein AGABI1DRAFT_125157 [Agaricus bisporus var. burnettii JB137-S8]|uniref:TRP C-terminal domain-containing protein n=1 Tax=Agaricus bisporus var. burnettii (strain JB137-S8 / ATCC MYA-4627 / FGSC 10392) TaxID=597362 RepID=K5XHF1_AGABU|nr:uncharacterized protein AGABI1DRAFT_125157 [Agaricus bisporus var. burnettii JB137-S8]EKM82697.1 hypothetical protein AGABI1DRAFT_125157 [Agaricus bisporus var. burnettii JB137-S8]
MAVEPLLATRAQRAFILTISIQAIVVLAMVGITFGKVRGEVDFSQARYRVRIRILAFPTGVKLLRRLKNQTLSCYLALFALAEIFELFMAFDALRLRNIIQLVGILAFHLALMVFAALQVHQTRIALVMSEVCINALDTSTCGGNGSLWQRIEPFLVVAPCIIAAAWLFMLFWIKRLYAEFGWAIFHVVGANPKMKTMYQYYQIMICLLKFDFFCFTGVTMQLLIVVLTRDTAEFGVTVAAIPVVLVLLVLCGIAVQREIKTIMSISLVLMLAAESYLYKLVRFYQPSSRDEYETTRATLTVFTIVAFLLLLATFVVGIRCFSDFDRGLLNSKIRSVSTRPKYSKASTSEMSEPKQGYQGVPIGPRMSIE